MAMLPSLTCEIIVRTKSAFAVQHLLAATTFSRQCEKIEKDHKNSNLGNFFDEIIACTSATVMLAVASIESNINEHLENPKEIFPNLTEDASREFCLFLSRCSILDKYDHILTINSLTSLEKDKSIYQNTKALINLRNELVHFHPEWHDNQKKHKGLSKELNGKFPPTPFISQSGSPLFPNRIMGHGCTKWAVTTARKFMKELSIKANVIDRFKQFDDRITP